MIPDEFDYREVLHQEDDEFPDDWMHRSYPVGHAKADLMGWTLPTQTQKKRWAAEMREREARRATLKGGFGFH